VQLHVTFCLSRIWGAVFRMTDFSSARKCRPVRVVERRRLLGFDIRVSGNPQALF
jgi:hypothetical protein